MTKNELKKKFEKYLISQGLSEKTKSGNPSTVYAYIHRVNKVCDSLYNGHSQNEWTQLANDIYPILGFYLLCKKDSFYINHSNFGKLKGFLYDFCNIPSPVNRQTVEQYFQINVFENKKIYTNQYVIIKNFINNLPKTYFIELRINDKDILKRTKLHALQKFYDFLKDENYNPSAGNKSASEQSKSIKTFYLKTSKKLSYLQNQGAGNKLYILSKGGTNKKCPKIIPSMRLNNRLETKVSAAWVQDVLRISRWTLKRLVENNIFIKYDHNMFSISDINAYIRSNFHPSQYAKNPRVPEGNKVKQWWEVKDVKAHTGLNEKYIQRLRIEKKVTYITVSKNKYIFYPYDFKLYTKIKPLFIDEKNLISK